MGSINDASAAISAMFKFYHSDRTKFYPTAAAAVEMSDEMYAATISTGDTTSQTIIRLVRSSTGTWMTKALLDTKTGVGIGIVSGVGSGMFARMGQYVYYTNGQGPVQQIRARTSSQATDAKYLWEAGLPDPNAVRRFHVCDSTSGVTYSEGDGQGSAGVSRAVQTRRFGTGSMEMTQTWPNTTASLSFTNASALDWTSFSDDTTASGSDMFAMNLYRYDKKQIAEIRVDLICNSAANYYTAYCAVTGSTTDPNGSTWDAWHPVQNTIQAQWSNNPYDNEMFNVRIRKDYFGGSGSPSWAAITTVKVSMKSGANAGDSRPARICVNDIRLLKSPPVVKTNRIQCATFEHSEEDSKYGWLTNTATFTKPTFNYTYAREGAACIAVAEGEVATLKFDSAKDFSTFPDGNAVDTTCVLRCNLTWKPLGYKAPGWTWAGTFTAPVIKFTDDSAQYRQVSMFALGNLQGGGVTKQALWKATAAAPWSGSAAFDWENVTKIQVYGPADSVSSPEPYFFDDLRFERPYDAQQPVYIFEPIERYAIDAAADFLGAQFKDMSWVIDLGAEALKFIFGNLSYQTYGMGWMTYPDFDHSSIGLAGCTLNAYGSKPFGCRFRFTGTHDLGSYKIPVINYPPSWTDFPNEMGPIKWSTIPAGVNDKFSIWVACPPEQINNIDRIFIRLYGNNSGVIDQENYMEYSISGLELQKMVSEDKEIKGWQKEVQDILDGINAKSEATTQMGLSLLRQSNTNVDIIKQLVQTGVKYFGKDRGGWPSAIYSWKRKDMITVENSQSGRAFDIAAVRGIGIEVVAKGGGATVCVDNFMMKKEGALNGDYYYSVLLEDKDGNLSPSSDLSIPAKITNGDAVLENIYVPKDSDLYRVANKQIYRLGGLSNERRFVGNCAVSNDKYYDSVDDDHLGKVAPDDAFAPPVSKVMRSVNNVMYYGNITKDRVNEVFPYRVMCSQAFVPFRVSDFKAIDIPEEKGSGVTAIEGYYGKIIIWTPDSMWTVNQGLQGVPVRRNGKGCIARDSVALSDYGMIWLSRDGLMIGDISKVDDNFFKPINTLFTSKTEDELSNAKGFVLGQYYYLFYNQNAADGGTGDGICCYLPERAFSELTGPFDMTAYCRWDGGTDGNDIYYGRNDGRIYKLFSGDYDYYGGTATAIATTLRTRDFSHPGIQYEKWLRAFYLSAANIGSVSSTIKPKVYINETALETMPIWTATTTTVKTYCQPAIQGDRGTHISMALSGTGTYKITEMIMKVEVEEDVEYKV